MSGCGICVRISLRGFAFGFQSDLVWFKLLCLPSLSLFVTVLFFIHRLCEEEKLEMGGESCIERRSVGLGYQRA